MYYTLNYIFYLLSNTDVVFLFFVRKTARYCKVLDNLILIQSISFLINWKPCLGCTFLFRNDKNLTKFRKNKHFYRLNLQMRGFDSSSNTSQIKLISLNSKFISRNSKFISSNSEFISRNSKNSFHATPYSFHATQN